MTTATLAKPSGQESPKTPGRTSTLTGTRALAKLAARRDRMMLIAWIYVLTALVAGTAYSFKKLFPTPAGRAEFALSAGHNPALLSLYGPLYGNSIGSLTAWRYGGFAALGAGLMSIFIVIRHTRADEETGRLELVGSAVVGRNAALTAALLIAVSANVGLAVLITAGLTLLGLPAAGVISLALAIAGSGLVFTAVAAVCAQLASTARAARGLALVVIGVTYLLRAVGDSSGPHGPRWLSWLSPIGWAELIRSFGAIRWWVLALPVAVAVMVVAAAAFLAVRRDYDAGMLSQRPGPARARASLRNPFALAWRLHVGGMIAWIAGAIIYGFIVGSAAKGIGGLLGSGQIRHIVTQLGGKSALTDAYLAAIMGFNGLIAAGYAVSAVLRLRSEETSGHADPVLATSASRVTWGLSHLLIAVMGTTLILVLTGLAAGLGFALRSGGTGEIGPLIAAGLGQLPASLVIGGVAAAFVGLLPEASVAAGWSALGIAVLMLFLGAALKLSHWVLDISPFQHLPKLPGGTVIAAPLIWLSAIALALAVAGILGLRRRDIT
ncbi:MAG: ABC transporter permease [Streptosporangiaceae bacterium]